MINRIISVFILLFIAVGTNAQTTVNPDISVIGDFRVFTHDDGSRLEEQRELNFTDPELELNLNGYLNPYARADATIAWHESSGSEIEEFYATFLRGLPLGLNLRVGKYLLEFGRLNPAHAHTWSFVKRPLVHEEFFGDEGLSDMAIRASFLLPTGNAYTEIMGAVLKGDALSEHDVNTGPGAEEPERVDPGFFGRITTSFAAADAAELALGVSALSSIFDRAENLRSLVVGADIKYKYVPSRYTTLLIETEGIIQARQQQIGDNRNSYGAYSYVDFRFKQRFNVGAIYEWTELKGITGKAKTRRGGLFAGFSPVEETSLVRLAGHWTVQDDKNSFWELTGQLIISLGPHKPHNF